MVILFINFFNIDILPLKGRSNEDFTDYSINNSRNTYADAFQVLAAKAGL